MRGKVKTIWDGIQYRQVSEEEAERLVSKDMAQIMPVDGTAMKFRKDFSGYRTREVRAKEPQQENKKRKETPAPDQNWKSHRKGAAKHLKKAFSKTTKAETLEYMEQELGIQT